MFISQLIQYFCISQVIQYWAEKGISGFTVFKFRLRRIEGQSLLTTNQVFTYLIHWLFSFFDNFYDLICVNNTVSICRTLYQASTVCFMFDLYQLGFICKLFCVGPYFCSRIVCILSFSSNEKSPVNLKSCSTDEKESSFDSVFFFSITFNLF